VKFPILGLSDRIVPSRQCDWSNRYVCEIRHNFALPNIKICVQGMEFKVSCREFLEQCERPIYLHSWRAAQLIQPSPDDLPELWERPSDLSIPPTAWRGRWPSTCGNLPFESAQATRTEHQTPHMIPITGAVRNVVTKGACPAGGQNITIPTRRVC
jgi:hypothetical protein